MLYTALDYTTVSPPPCLLKGTNDFQWLVVFYPVWLIALLEFQGGRMSRAENVISLTGDKVRVKLNLQTPHQSQ